MAKIKQAVFSAAGTLIPFLGTAIGASAVFFIKKQVSSKGKKFSLGLASGVMLAASVWSLLIPAMDAHGLRGGVPWVPAVVGFLLGVGAMTALDAGLPRFCKRLGRRLDQNAMLVLAVTVHNLPEGMAVGVALAGASALDPESLGSALLLCLGIAIQNIPEGAIISAPLASSGKGTLRAFAAGAASGAVEPLGALLTLGLTALLTPVLPYVLAFAAGTMVYVVFEELASEIHSEGSSFWGVWGMGIGFALMMLLDAALG